MLAQNVVSYNASMDLRRDEGCGSKRDLIAL